MKYLGFASGKISTYLQYGVPVLCNDIGPYSDAIIENGAGYRVSEVSEISKMLAHIPPLSPEIIGRCRSFFAEQLDSTITIPPVATRIMDAATRRD